MSASLTPAHAKYANFWVSSSLGHFLGSAGTSSKEDGTARDFGDTYMAGCPLSGWVVVFCVRFSASSTIFATCRFGRFDSHISNFPSQFCNFCFRLLDVTSSSAVVCCPGQTRVDVHVLVALIHWCCCNIVLQESEVVAQKEGIAQRMSFWR